MYRINRRSNLEKWSGKMEFSWISLTKINGIIANLRENNAVIEYFKSSSVELKFNEKSSRMDVFCLRMPRQMEWKSEFPDGMRDLVRNKLKITSFRNTRKHLDNSRSCIINNIAEMRTTDISILLRDNKLERRVKSRWRN